jgi:hypothetical protein
MRLPETTADDAVKQPKLAAKQSSCDTTAVRPLGLRLKMHNAISLRKITIKFHYRIEEIAKLIKSKDNGG